MSSRRVSPILLVMVVCSLAQSLSAQRPDFSEARQIIRDGMARDSLAGLAFAMGQGDSILWEEGFGWANRETRVPATANTPFYLASVTKTITATVAMILRERGRLDLDQPGRRACSPWRAP